MTPSTQKLVDFLGSSRDPQIDDFNDTAEHENSFDPKILQLQIKKKRQIAMIRQMLQDSGYEDLARMTSIGKEDLGE